MKVGIIGGGLTGLAIGYTFKCFGFENFVILESSSAVGGRIQTRTLLNSSNEERSYLPWFDLGAQWIGPNQTHLLNLISKLGLKLIPQYHDGDSIIELDQTVLQYSTGLSERNDFGKNQLSGLKELVQKFKNLIETIFSSFEETMKQERTYLDSISVEKWVQLNSELVPSRQVFSLTLKSILGIDLNQISMLHALWIFKSGQGYNSLVFTHGGAQQDKLEGGCFQICQKLVEYISADQVLLNSSITKIQQNEREVFLLTKAGKVFSFDYVICTVPLTQINHIQFEPSLETERTQYLNQFSIGKIIKILVSFKDAFWRKKGLSGEMMSNGSPVCFTFDHSLPNQEIGGALLCYIVGREANEWNLKSVEERKGKVLQQLSRIFGKECLNPVGYSESFWNHDSTPFVGGAYFCCHSPQSSSNSISHTNIHDKNWILRRPFARVYFAGTELAFEFSGYMNGAVSSAHQVAHEILELIKK